MSLSDNSIKNLSQQIATINQWPESEVNNFLDDKPEKALQLVLTLKHYANPLAGYPIDDEVVKDPELANIIKSLEDPNLLQLGSNLTLEQKKYLSDLMRVKFDRLANDIILKNKIKQEDIDAAILQHFFPKPSAPELSDDEGKLDESKMPTPSAPPMTKEDQEALLVQAWWNSLSAEEQKKIKDKYNSLTPDSKEQVKQRTYYSYHVYPENDYYYYRHMCLIDAELSYIQLRAMSDVSALILEGLIRGAVAAFQLSKGISFRHIPRGSGSGNHKIDGEGVLIAAAVAAFLAFAVSAFIASIYAMKKTYNSLRNIFTGKKILRSFYRLTGTAGGAYLGVFGGAMVGAILGSIIPGVGTAIGAILGMIFGAGVGSGLGSIITKYTAKFISFLFNKDELNPTNPNKWKLSKREEANLRYHDVNIDAVNLEMKRIKKEKSEIGVAGSFFWTKSRKRKNELNNQLKQVKKSNSYAMEFYPPRYSLFCPPVEKEYDIPRSYRPKRK